MGLDMYAHTRQDFSNGRPDPISEAVDFDNADGDEQLFYWRKHPDLHGWMERLYREKGGTAESFNCVTLKLTLDDLDRLEADLDALPETTGFFFGQSDPSRKAEDIRFIRAARDAIADGKSVYYSSWW